MSEQKDLRGRVEEWLEKQGYPLEMHTAAAFKRAGFQVTIADFYEDVEEGKSREIDVTAARFSSLDRDVFLQVCIRVECKRSDKPWVLFASEAQPERHAIFNVFASEVGRWFLIKAHQKPVFRKRLFQLPLLYPKGMCYGLTQAFRESRDAYKAIMSAAKASIARTIEFDNLPASEDAPRMCGVVFPLVVLDAPLFTCVLDTNGQPKAVQVPEGVLFWKGLSTSHSATLIHVCTKDALSGLIEAANETADVLIEAFEGMADKVAAHISDKERLIY